MSRKHFKRLFCRKYEEDMIKWIYVYDFSVDYDAIVVGDILDIHKYLMKKNGVI